MKRMPRIKCICKNCGKEFERTAARIKRGRGIYCSEACRWEGVGKQQTGSEHPKWSRERVYCANCGKELNRIHFRRERTKNHFCSRLCKGEWMSKNLIPHNKSEVVIQTCPICNEQFRTTEAMIKKGRGICCSDQCRAVYVGKQQRGTNHPRWNSVLITCDNCGKLFYRQHAHLDKVSHNLCSENCRNEFLIGEHASGWQGGISYGEYCEKWHGKRGENLRQRVRAFFGYRCALCGEPQNGKALQVHHVDYNKQMCCDRDPHLFVPLCDRCHPLTNFNRGYWRLYFRELIALQYGGKCYYRKEEMPVPAVTRT